MAVYTSINSTDLSNWIKEFDLEEPSDFKGISSGVTNTNYLITLPDTNYILTIFEHNYIDELPFYVNLMSYLAKNNFSCPMPVENKKGQALALLKEKPALMVSFLDGKEKVIVDADSCYLVGKNLAKFHSTATDFTELKKNTRGLLWISDIYTSLKKHLSFEDQKIIELEINFQMLLDNTDLPEGIIHGDLFRDNVLFLNNNVSGFIDLYYACNERLVYDIAITINDWCINEDGKMNKLMYTEFIKGYESERKLTENEQDRLNKDLRLAALRFWLSRLEDSYNAKEGEITSIKDPNHFKAILLNRQAMENYVN
jgi:homoserine kinase type II